MHPYLGYPICDQFVERAIQSSTNEEVRSVNVLYTKWYDMSGDCDLFVETAAEKELLIYHEDSWLLFVDNAYSARIKNRNPPPERSFSPHRPLDPWIHHCHFFRMTWVLGDGPYKGKPSLLFTEMNDILGGHSNERLANVKLKDVEVDPYCGDAIIHASEEDVDLLVNLSHLWVDTLERDEEIEMQSKYGHVEKTSKHREISPGRTVKFNLRIRWHCPDPPYKKYDTRGIKHAHICEMLHTALKMTDSPSLAAIWVIAVNIKWKSGDVDVVTSDRDGERAVKFAHLWFPHLIQGDAAQVPGIYTPQSQTPSKGFGRRRSNASKRNLEDVSASQTNLWRSQSKSAKRKRQKIRSQQRAQEEQESQAPQMNVVA
ncbi:uncharacterized protein N7443_006598 [Penicillium atrosanguineum]|uniref:uncharacterized protein n=1 Tax=Penicillium atrosanguineum TaxID=1132637 RepID=UPI002395C904|nr:uncharacterized protein N7443_006598 [Penicillium atrosanguineum]KAJ5298478.1 hypothetical protein N7443_006598 [Penicillium atrosanguineum]